METIVNGLMDSLNRHTVIVGDFFRGTRFRTHCSAREELGTNFAPFKKPLSVI